MAKVYNVSDLVKEIRVAIDSNLESDQLATIGDMDQLALEEIIGSKIAEAARIVVLNAPSYLLDGAATIPVAPASSRASALSDDEEDDDDTGDGEPKDPSIEWKTTAGRISLPGDFLRLVSFKMSDWSYAVSEAISQTDPMYAQQFSRYGGLRGCPQRPVVAIVPRGTGLVLEFFSCKGGETATVDHALYIQIPSVENGQIKLCEKLHDATVYYAAYLTAISTGEATLAEALLGIVNELNK